MELDDMKLAWQTLDRRTDLNTALSLQLFKESKFDKMRAALRPLSWGLTLQMLFGCAVIVASSLFWSTHTQTPHLLVAGVIMQIYGILVMVVTARVLWSMSQIDYAAPVLDIQRQLSELRNWFPRSGWLLGVPWLLLWVPADMMVCAWFGFDLYTALPKLIYIGLVSGVVGIGLTYLADRYVRWPAKMTKAIEDGSQRNLKKARGFLEEIARFEKM